MHIKIGVIISVEHTLDCHVITYYIDVRTRHGIGNFPRIIIFPLGLRISTENLSVRQPPIILSIRHVLRWDLVQERWNPESEDVQELPVEQLEGNERKRVTSSADELRSESDQTVVILPQTVLEQTGPPAVTTRSERALRSTLGEDYVLSSNVRVKRWVFALTN